MHVVAIFEDFSDPTAAFAQRCACARQGATCSAHTVQVEQTCQADCDFLNRFGQPGCTVHFRNEMDVISEYSKVY